MMDWIAGQKGLDAVFLGCAVVGGLIFLIRVVLLFIGIGDHDTDGDVGDGGHDAVAHGDTDVSFHFFSVQGLSSFFLMFGLSGMAVRGENDASGTVAVAVAGVIGLITMFVMGALFKAANRLRSSGNVSVVNAVGQEGRVYLTIPSGGRGQVEVEVQGRLKVLDAVAEQPVELATGQHVRVVRVIEGGVLVVERAV